MKNLKTLVLVLLVALFAFQAVACNQEPVVEPIDGPHMSERVYERMDEEAVYALMDEIYLLLETDGNRHEILEKRSQFFDEYYSKAFTMRTLSSIMYDKDVTNEYWQEESVWADNFAVKFQNDTIELEKAIFSSEFYGEYFTRIYGKDYAAMILDVTLDTDEQLEILAQISELEAEYNSLYASGQYSAIADLYIELVTLRNEYATSIVDENGIPYYANYMDYAYANIYSREYTPDEVAAFRGYVRKHMSSLRNKLYAHSGDAALRQDGAITKDQLIEFMPEIIENTVPEMMSSWDYMMERELYDFDYSPYKANTSYVTTFSEYDDAFMFLNAGRKVTSDLSTLIHEFGHYNEVFMADPDLADDNYYSYDLAETHSQAFELLTMPALENVLNNNYSNKNIYKSYVFNAFINSIWAMMSNCAFDEFEYTVYNAPAEQLSASFLNSTYNKIWENYWPSSSYSYYDIPHFFGSPAYCISYSVSMVFAAEIWASSDPINNYVKVVKYGCDNALSTVYEGVGLADPLSEITVYTIEKKMQEACKSTFGW